MASMRTTSTTPSATLAPGAMVRGIGLQRLTVRYGMPGTYTLRLDLLDASGRLTTSSRTVVVKA